MQSTAKSKQPVRLSNEELRKSRMGLLGRFPAEDLYEPEEDLKQQGEDEQVKSLPGRGRGECKV